MANYDFRAYGTRMWWSRFPEDAIGFSQWLSFRDEISLSTLNRLRAGGMEERLQHAIRCPRVFVSHRHSDSQFAVKIAQLANANGFEYWLDSMDPMLKSLSFASPSPGQVSLLTAAIIEMGILNCTHVIAVMTPNTKGSLWVPYEYGRITEIPTAWGRACAWKHPKLPYGDLADYLVFGGICQKQQEVEDWLRAEYYVWGKTHGSACPSFISWPDTPPKDLPE